MIFLKLTAVLISLYYIGLTLFFSGTLFLTLWLAAPAGKGVKETLFIVPQGASFDAVARRLEKKGLIKNRYSLYPIAWLNNKLSEVKAGKYRLDNGMSAERILDILVSGKTLKQMLTVPEGYNIFQIANVIERAGFDSQKNFINAATDQNFLESIGIIQDSVEGYLFPETYFFEDKTASRDIITAMTKHFWTIWHQNNFSKEAEKLGITPFKTLILASIVEEEAMIDKEKPVIASVFWNRIRLNMPLQADPTVRYGILVEKRINKKRLRTRDLRRITPYNTYRLRGLPKGPITNPGLTSIKAVIYPEKTDYIFFVSMNNRRHKFSKTLKEHNRAVRKYQLGGK